MVREKMSTEDLKDTRAKNLNAAIGNPGKHGRISEFADAYDLNPSLISQLLNRSRDMGEKLARKLETQLGLPYLSLDNPAGLGASIQATRDKLRPDQEELLRLFDQSSPEIRATILRALQPAPKSED